MPRIHFTVSHLMHVLRLTDIDYNSFVCFWKGNTSIEYWHCGGLSTFFHLVKMSMNKTKSFTFEMKIGKFSVYIFKSNQEMYVMRSHNENWNFHASQTPKRNGFFFLQITRCEAFFHCKKRQQQKQQATAQICWSVRSLHLGIWLHSDT